MTRRFWMAALAYLVPTFPLGYFWHLVTFHEQYAALQLYRADVIIPLGLSSMIIQALIFAGVYPRLFDVRKERFARSAGLAFVTFAALAWSFTTLPVAAKYDMTSVSMFMKLETAFTLLQFAIVCPLMGLAWRDSVATQADAGATGSIAHKA